MSFSILILTSASFLLFLSLALLACFRNYRKDYKIFLLINTFLSIFLFCLRKGGGDSPYYTALLQICRDGRDILIRQDIFSILTCQIGKINIDISFLSIFVFLIPFITIFFVSENIYGNSNEEVQEKYIFLLCIMGLALPGYFLSLIRFSIAIFFSYLILKKKSNFLIKFGAISAHTTGFLYLIIAVLIRNLTKIKYLIYRLLNELKIKKKYLFFNTSLLLLFLIALTILKEPLVKEIEYFLLGYLWAFFQEFAFNFSFGSITFICILFFWTFIIRKQLNIHKLIYISFSLVFLVNPFFGRFSLISFLFIAEATAKYITLNKDSLTRFIIIFLLLVPFLTFKSYYGFISDETPYSNPLGASYSTRTFSNAYE